MTLVPCNCFVMWGAFNRRWIYWRKGSPVDARSVTSCYKALMSKR